MIKGIPTDRFMTPDERDKDILRNARSWVLWFNQIASQLRAIDSTAYGWLFPKNVLVTGLPAQNHANDAAAAAGGVPIGGLYHNAGAVRVRLV